MREIQQLPHSVCDAEPLLAVNIDNAISHGAVKPSLSDKSAPSKAVMGWRLHLLCLLRLHARMDLPLRQPVLHLHLHKQYSMSTSHVSLYSTLSPH